MNEPAPPIALMIGFSSSFFWDRRDAVSRAGAVALDAPLTQAASLALEWHPAVIMMTEDLYAFDPSRFDALADMAGAAMAILQGEGESDDEITRRVLHAVSESVQRRTAQGERPTTPVPGRLPNVRTAPDHSAATEPFRRRHG